MGKYICLVIILALIKVRAPRVLHGSTNIYSKTFLGQILFYYTYYIKLFRLLFFPSLLPFIIVVELNSPNSYELIIAEGTTISLSRIETYTQQLFSFVSRSLFKFLFPLLIGFPLFNYIFCVVNTSVVSSNILHSGYSILIELEFVRFYNYLPVKKVVHQFY